MATISLVTARFWAEKRRHRLGLGFGKLLKLLSILVFSSAGVGCATTQGTAFDRQLLLELEEKNVRLEAEVTRLREEKLRADRKSDCSAEPRDTGTRASAEGPESLPVVQMGPGLAEGEAGDVSIRPAEPLAEEEPTDDDTRPVLTVRGKHEAWVSHRPVTAEDRKANSDPASQSKKLPQESN